MLVFDSNVISVSELNRHVRTLLESGLPQQWVGGEISNLTLAASGHAYFSLKDKNAQIRAVMFRNRVVNLDFRLREGMQVEVRGLVTLYEARGDYQINIDTVRQAGLGRLFEAFERLKAALAQEGLFDTAQKRALPKVVRSVGVVTSLQAAALRDVLTTLQRRMPSLPVILYPTPVQGDGAAQQIALAIRTASARAEVDVLLVCRGGGSIEDLWAFNEEVVARAIAACAIPVVSGVGHETDFTICDFVADIRAPTPTAAAELVSPDYHVLLAALKQQARRLARAVRVLVERHAQRVDGLAQRLISPRERLQRQQRELVQLARRLQYHARAVLQRERWRLDVSAQRLSHARPRLERVRHTLTQLAHALQHARAQAMTGHAHRLARLADQLDSLNPNAVLGRGYAIVQKRDGCAVRAASELAAGEQVMLRLAQGALDATINAVPQQQALPFE